MGFEIGRVGVDGQVHLVAVCDYCGLHYEAMRIDWEVILPEGWRRVGLRQQTGTIYGVPTYYSKLMCSNCCDESLEQNAQQ